MPDLDPRAPTDAALLASVQPRGARKLARRLGCVGVFAIAGWLAITAGAWVGARAWPWLAWVVGALVFVPTGVLLAAVGAVLTVPGGAAAEAELRRRLGQEPVDVAMRSVRADAAEVAPGQRGWIVLLQVVRLRDGFRIQVRVDLRTDTQPVQGEAVGVRGPQLKVWVAAPETLDDWERARRAVRPDGVHALASLLDHLDRSSLSPGARGRGALRVSGALIRIGAAGNEWPVLGVLDSDDGSPLARLTWQVMATLDWDPLAGPAR